MICMSLGLLVSFTIHSLIKFLNILQNIKYNLYTVPSYVSVRIFVWLHAKFIKENIFIRNLLRTFDLYLHLYLCFVFLSHVEHEWSLSFTVFLCSFSCIEVDRIFFKSGIHLLIVLIFCGYLPVLVHACVDSIMYIKLDQN